MDALRAALGQDTISFYGASYGTLLGAQYAERYPRRVRALALDSVMDHTLDTDGFLKTETDTAQDGFDEFVTWCARDSVCALHGRDVRTLWASLLDRAAKGTLTNPYEPGAKLSVLDLIAVAHASFYQPQWYALAFFIKQADEGSALVSTRSAEPVDYSFAAVFCDDWEMPLDGYADFARRMTALRARAPQMIVSPLALAATVSCLGWESPASNPQRRLRPARTPTLLINSRHDPATPHVWARGVAEQLGPQATLLTYEGWGHVSYGRTDCVTTIVDRYLIDRRRPAPGASCEGVVPEPFGVGKPAAPVVPRTRYR
jgi:pimeloyl-ACP methyl ester carboxylesterase